MTSTGLVNEPGVVARKKSGIVKFLRRDGVAYMFLAPWLLGFFVLTVYPMAYSLWLGFTNYDFTQPNSTQWIGIANYLKMFGPVFGLSNFTASTGEVMRVDPYYMKSLSVTFTYVLVSVPLKLIFALAVAVLMNQKLRGVSFYRSVYYIPTLLGGSVAIAVLWRKLFEKEGLLNGLLGAIGFTNLPGWITNPKFALWTLILLTVWQFGSSMIIFLAGLKQIPQEYYEAASVDGASKTRQFFSITLPLLSPVILFTLVLQTITTFQAFTQAYIIGGGGGGVLNSTLFYTLHLYIQGWQYHEMGYASAMAWVLLIIIGVFTAIVFKSSNLWVSYGTGE
ncbi:MAG: sugar ABC transporter permease [Anaerolineae bacterium]|nr:sugar ABC transporter permease [Anaerolineae bacterium]MCB9130494.1 sugar ABC transporter permease [Anaerolineales bacterium]MCB0228615.1 sugar ABC transporter permease [Anaerolineae bacterium]MCB0236233.1 sugar ABC transporter permease [Anaerolineae bacterium]MCB0240320.1 sugar ABC transporter permease [Anaerolineae bacterium]